MSPTATFDADAARAARLEALSEQFTFTWNGQEFALPTPKEWPIEVVALLAKADIAAALEMLLGTEGYADFLKGKPTLADIEGIFGAVSEWQGMSLGE